MSALTWQKTLQSAITDPLALLSYLNIDPQQVTLAEPEILKNFKLLVPRGFADRMQRGNIQDPLFLQVWPFHAEGISVPGFIKDPLEENTSTPIPGLLHKYFGRVLWIMSGACAVNCRYCFRRHFPYEMHARAQSDISPVIDYIAAKRDIQEVILSGGDPLMFDDNRLSNIAEQLSNIPHLTTLRIHTRVPIVLPERITPKLTEWLTQTRLKIVIVLHSNHPNELDQSVENALRFLQHPNITLLNQSVLLKHINDHADVLSELSRRLFAIGVLPYYLHQLDPVSGAAHFGIADDTARNLYAELTRQLPGYLLPKLVREVPNAPSKIPL